MRRMSKSCRFSLMIMIMNLDGDGGDGGDGGEDSDAGGGVGGDGGGDGGGGWVSPGHCP